MTEQLSGKKILLIISGGIAAYKALELIRLLRKEKASVHCILTKGGEHFVTALSVSALSGNPVYTDLWALKEENQIGHIQLSREADLIAVIPASANLLAKWALGLADELASLTLLASDKPVLFAPAMNPQMWAKPQTCENIEKLEGRGFIKVGPETGDSACGETGEGRMSEPETILEEIKRFFLPGPLIGKRAIVTSGPTFEAIDPVRFIGNRSSGKQGHAIARSLAQAGAEVTLVSGPVSIPAPPNVKKVLHVESALEMHEAAINALPADIAVCAAAVADWRPEEVTEHKIKKSSGKLPKLSFIENPDILSSLANHTKRPALVIGFAAETKNLLETAKAKLEDKNCDWILANQVGGTRSVFGNEKNHVHLITKTCTEEWPEASKNSIAGKLTDKIAKYLDQNGNSE